MTVYTNDERIEPVHPTLKTNGTVNGNFAAQGTIEASDVVSRDRFGYRNEQSPDWILHIHKARVQDSGIYECQVNTEPKKSKYYQLWVVGRTSFHICRWLNFLSHKSSSCVAVHHNKLVLKFDHLISSFLQKIQS